MLIAFGLELLHGMVQLLYIDLNYEANDVSIHSEKEQF